ncbi:Protein Brevis radix-like 3 [Abeliophyllum distichum]|uniref:Protein Brevis radix-like 3 n=1 Tax=Abeliophyllum distichum TaxID=126358 RepID=A0ABD1VA01_9LAMI
MLTCIACSKQQTARSLHDPPEEDDTAATPSSKQPIKALTNQIKDMAVKASGAYRSCNPCSRSSSHNQSRAYTEPEAGWVSERFYGTYKRTGSLNPNPRLWGKELEAKLKALSSGEGTPSSVSGRSVSVVFMEEDEPKEWVAQVEPGVLITFVSLPQGGNDLKRIQFSREMFNKWQAQRWWADNYDKVMELYNVQGFNSQAVPQATLPKSEEEDSKIESAENSPIEHHQRQSRHYFDSGDLNSTPKLSSISVAKTAASSVDASAQSISSRESDRSGELSVSNASDLDTEWVEQDEPGVYITIGTLPGGTRELRRVRFSRERFGEMQARLWWEENRARIQQQYL